jgi:hypothetical protein
MKNVFRELVELTGSELDTVAGGHVFHFTFALHGSALHEIVIVGRGNGSLNNGSFNGNGSRSNGNNNGNISIA